ncbi:MAG: regulatory protein GemA [Rhizobiaceae bacterium]|nr:regulatory protein GemA [Rhizobiaceae bacterium]
MSAIPAIHSARRQLGLDEDAARDLYERETGKRSLRLMSAGEQGKVLDAMRRAGFKPAKSGLEGPFAKKLQALWIDAWNLGIVRDRRDAALIAFVKRQTRVDHTRFLIDGEDAAKAIDALKAWMTREAGVDWSSALDRPAWLRLPGAQIALAQWQILIKAGMEPAAIEPFRAFVAEHAKPVDRMEAKDWQPVMNLLGERVRKAVT